MTLLGCREVREHGDWVTGSCPFEAKHQSGIDNNPSFGIRAGEPSYYNCFSCGSKGTLNSLPTNLFLDLNRDFSEVREFVYHREKPLVSNYQYTEMPKLEPIPVVDENVFNSKFSETKVKGTWRGVSNETLHTENIRYDHFRNRVVIPIRNKEGSIIGVKGRATDPKDNPKYLIYTDLSPTDGKKYGIWYGMHWKMVEGKPLYIVEGEIDAILLKQYQPLNNVWACMGVGVSKAQIAELQKQTHTVIYFLDNDAAGKGLTDLLTRKMKGLVLQYRIPNYFGCKDPGDAVKSGKIQQISKGGLIKCC
jgi:DNA primase